MAKRIEWKGYTVRLINKKVESSEWSNSLRQDARCIRTKYDIILDLWWGSVSVGHVSMSSYNFPTTRNREWYAMGIPPEKKWYPYSHFHHKLKDAVVELLNKAYPKL